MNLMLILKDLKYWHYFHPFLLDLLMCPREETMNLYFVENLVGYGVYPTHAWLILNNAIIWHK